jgi:phosphoglycolate phosphatase-like HAD superfamily hydrolase
VIRSLYNLYLKLQAGYDYDEETFEKIFRRIYSAFGSSAPYSAFPDAQPFMRWAREKGLTVGVVSNAEYRYKDVILPALGLNQVQYPLDHTSQLHASIVICFLCAMNA